MSDYDERLNRKFLEELTNVTMRGAVARTGMLFQVISVEAVSTIAATGLSIFAVYLAAVVNTAASLAFACFIVAGTLGFVAKGGFLLHRKWKEYEASEKQAESVFDTWKNPAIRVDQRSKALVGIVNTVAAAGILLPVLAYSIHQLFYVLPTALFVLVSTYSVTLSLISVFGWIKASSE